MFVFVFEKLTFFCVWEGEGREGEMYPFCDTIQITNSGKNNKISEISSCSSQWITKRDNGELDKFSLLKVAISIHDIDAIDQAIRI